MLAFADICALTISLALERTRRWLGIVSLLFAEDLDVLHGTRLDSVDLVAYLSKILLLALGSLLCLSVSEGVHVSINVLLSSLHEPLMLILDLLFVTDTPPGNPVVGDGIENQTGAFGTRSHASFFSELFPFGLGFVDGTRFLSGENLNAFWHINEELALGVLQNLSVRSMLGLLSLLDVKELLVQCAQV